MRPPQTRIAAQNKAIYYSFGTVESPRPAGLTNMELHHQFHKFPLHADDRPLPPGLRAVDNDTGLIVFEQPPAHKTVAYQINRRSDVRRETIAIPWQVYVIKFDPIAGWVETAYMLWRHAPLKSLSSRVGQPLIANIYGSGKVCLPNNLGDKKHKTVSELVNAVYEAIWSSVFNNDIMPMTTPYDPDGSLVSRKDLTSSSNPLLPTAGGDLGTVCSYDYAGPPEIKHTSSLRVRGKKHWVDADGDILYRESFVSLRSILDLYKTSIRPIYRINSKFAGHRT